jgi:hypothetical protein
LALINFNFLFRSAAAASALLGLREMVGTADRKLLPKDEDAST